MTKAVQRSNKTAATQPRISTSPGAIWGQWSWPQIAVASGAQIDRTSVVLANIAGKYRSSDEQGFVFEDNVEGTRAEIDITIDSASKSLIIVNHNCGIEYDFELKAVTTTGDVFVLRGAQTDMRTFEPDSRKLYYQDTKPILCGRFEKLMAHISDRGIAVDYFRPADGVLLIGDAPDETNHTSEFADEAHSALIWLTRAKGSP